MCPVIWRTTSLLSSFPLTWTHRLEICGFKCWVSTRGLTFRPTHPMKPRVRWFCFQTWFPAEDWIGRFHRTTVSEGRVWQSANSFWGSRHHCCGNVLSSSNISIKMPVLWPHQRQLVQSVVLGGLMDKKEISMVTGGGWCFIFVNKALFRELQQKT